MNKALVITVTLGFIGVASLAEADAPLIRCVGTESGGSGPRQYAYDVDSASYPMVEFRVGTKDLEAANYASVLMPDGWTFAVESVPGHHMHDVKTPPGKVSPGPCRCLTRGSVVWQAKDPDFAVEFFAFGYDHPWASEDVSWILQTEREGPPPKQYTFREDWGSSVGTGFGPVHGPVPEPSTLILLTMGTLVLLAYAWRRRRGR
ncbi:MAG: PEP-CTERM sorting domain-containing protein [Planctomycetota bacterium]